jgi:hypothetical protein
MWTNRRIRGLAIVPALALAVACSDTPNEPSELDVQINEDVAAYVADLTSDDIVLMTSYAELSMGAPALSPPFDGSLTVTREVTYYDDDAAQVEMAFYDPLETATINFVFSLQGERSRTTQSGTMSMEVSRDRNLWLSGLEGEETTRTWNGTGSRDVDRVRQSDDRGTWTYDMDASALIEDVVVGVPRIDNPWPLSGTITREIHVEVVNVVGDTFIRDRTVVITFNGTQFVIATVNGEEFEIDLASRTHKRRHEG